MSYFLGKNVIITGASSGIGRALAISLAKQGANVVAAARNHEALLQLQTEVQNFSGKIIVQLCDVTQEKDCVDLIQQTVTNLGSLDILINNAGISMRASFDQTSTEVLKRIFDTNYWGTVYCSKQAIPYLLKSKGSLVTVSSVTGLKGLPGRSGYSSSKFALHGLMESIRMEYLHKDLNVLIACPGFTATSIRINALNADGKVQAESPIDEKKVTSPKDVANDILQAIRDRKDFMLTDRQGKIIKWLNFFAPRFLEKLIHRKIAKESNSPILK